MCRIFLISNWSDLITGSNWALVGGFTIEGKSFLGFDFYAEWDRNKRYFQYPNAALFVNGKNHKISSEESDVWFFNIFTIISIFWIC